MRYGYPLLLDVSQRLVVVVGGGAVAARKVKGVLEAGATQVRVVAPRIDPGMPAGVERIEKEFASGHLDGAGLVFAATDHPGVNDAVVRECRGRGILVNRADVDEEDPGDFATPAVHRDGGLTVMVSAGGSPALAAKVRDAVVAKLDGRWGILAEVMKVLRPRIRALPGVDIGRRRAMFRDLASDEALGVLERDGAEGLWRWLEGRHGAFGQNAPG